MHKLTILFLIISLLALGFANATLAQEKWTCPEGFEGQTLRFFNWSTYVAENTIPDFEDACGVQVEYFEYGSNEEMLAVIRSNSAQYDITVPSGNTVGIMIEEGLAQPLKKELIPNMVNIAETFADPPYDPGNDYSVPYQWGTIAIGYDQNIVDEEITSWEQVWDYDGPVAWLNDPRAMMGLALMLIGHDPNSTDPDEIDEARQFLEDRSDNVDVIADDNGQDLLNRGDVDITIEYSGDIFQLIYECECDDFVYVIPAEGANVWTDNMVVPYNAPNPDLAMVFIDYILDPQVGADLSNFTAYGTPNQASLDAGLIDEELLSNPGIYPSEDVMDKLFFANKVPAEAEETYLEAWSKLIAAMSE
ncbi:MAG: spermidine/putrescine ABC transporter substrate-binding protein [Anaerolineae bacterium]|nr:spermidine/putrescine ABC transporter substrate-binding protein [Anaerolineae bacterium]